MQLFNALVAIICSFTQNCELLPNGTYKVSFHEYDSDNYTLVINDTSYTQYFSNGDSARGVIQWTRACTFKLVDLSKPGPDTSTRLLKTLYNSFGEQCIELREKKGDTISFRTTYTGNIHITGTQGIFIKVK